jgi:shikimate kinase
VAAIASPASELLAGGLDRCVAIGDYLSMLLLTRARFLLPAVAVTLLLASGCGGKSASGPSKTTVRRTTTADVVAVLQAHDVAFKGTITCVGQAPGIVDCLGYTTSGTMITATLSAATSGLSCTGPMVVNVGKTQYSEPNEKCS